MLSFLARKNKKKVVPITTTKVKAKDTTEVTKFLPLVTPETYRNAFTSKKHVVPGHIGTPEPQFLKDTNPTDRRAQIALEAERREYLRTKAKKAQPRKRLLPPIGEGLLHILKDALPYNIRKSFDILQRLKAAKLSKKAANSLKEKTPAERIQRLNTYLAFDDLKDVEFINIDPSARISTTTGTRNLNKEVNPLLKVPSRSKTTVDFWMSLRPHPSVLNYSDAISIAVEIYTNDKYRDLKNMTDRDGYVRALEDYN